MEKNDINIGALSETELLALMREITEELELRAMQRAGDDQCVCCGRIIPEGTQVCRVCYLKAMADGGKAEGLQERQAAERFDERRG